jgi:hypothetical protein
MEEVESVVINLKFVVKSEQNFDYSSLINVSMRNERSISHITELLQDNVTRGNPRAKHIFR